MNVPFETASPSRDPVEEALLATFPASDPPAWAGHPRRPELADGAEVHEDLG